MKVLATLLISLFTIAAVATLRPDINVNPNIEVAADRPILLKDIATIGNVPADIERQAGNLIIFEALGVDQKLELKNINVVKAIRNKLSESNALGTLAWTYFVPEDVKIKAHRNFINSQTIQFDLTSELKKRCGNCQIIIKDLKVPTIKENAEMKNYQVEYDTLKLSGSFLLPVQVFTSESPKKTYWLTGSVRISKEAPVTLRQIQFGEHIAASDFKMDWVDVTFVRDGVPTATEVTGQIAGKTFNVGQPIFKSDIKREVAIKRGQIVKILVGDNEFEVTGQGISEEQGYIGDLIRIKNTDTQKLLSGKVIDSGIVRVN
jgi:flagella basal body P-ring formation protein FlgA